MAEPKLPTLAASKQVDALKTQQATAKTTQVVAAKPVGVAAKTVQTMAKTTQADAKSAAIASKNISMLSSHPKTAQPQAEDEEEEEEEEEEGDGLTFAVPTRTSSLAMPSNYVPPKLAVNAADMPISLAPTVKGKTTLATARLKGARSPKGGLKKKKKKRKPKALDVAMLKSATAISVSPGEREMLARGRRRFGGDAGQRASKRKWIVLGVVIAIVIAGICIGIVLAFFLGGGKEHTTTVSPASTTK